MGQAHAGGHAAQFAAAGVGEGETRPVRDVVLINVAAAIAAYRGLDGEVRARRVAGLRGAAAAIDSGAATKTLGRWAQAVAQQNGLLSRSVDRAIP
ncbi:MULTISPECIES: hypothetical protein [Actinomadura]|uniref:hypothetical protein n=1 Tax=unclassified Actinomadura TaxID=2626254 RepID=UPI0033951DDD